MLSKETKTEDGNHFWKHLYHKIVLLTQVNYILSDNTLQFQKQSCIN